MSQAQLTQNKDYSNCNSLSQNRSPTTSTLSNKALLYTKHFLPF